MADIETCDFVAKHNESGKYFVYSDFSASGWELDGLERAYRFLSYGIASKVLELHGIRNEFDICRVVHTRG